MVTSGAAPFIYAELDLCAHVHAKYCCRCTSWRERDGLIIVRNKDAMPFPSGDTH